jgi:protein-S-isoprenylcysteine O-methyltransferase Ste14
MRRGPARTPPREPFLHIPVPWVFVLGYVIGVGLQVAVPVQLNSSSVSNALNIAGGILFLVGAGLAGWAWLLFRQARTTAVPGEASRVLVTHGPYRVTRNPMYVGLTIAYVGEAGALRPSSYCPSCSRYVNWFVIPVEEASLKMFEGYGEYSARVHRWL